MGEASRRGAYEQRKAAAIARQEKERKEKTERLAEIQRARPQRSKSVLPILIAAMVATQNTRKK